MHSKKLLESHVNKEIYNYVKKKYVLFKFLKRLREKFLIPLTIELFPKD